MTLSANATAVTPNRQFSRSSLLPMCTKAGALSTTVGAPVRYMHSTVQLCHEDDIEATVALLKTFPEYVHELLPPDEM